MSDVLEQTDDRAELASYVEIWWQAVNDFLDLLESIPEEEWDTPTDLPGWDVRAVAAHVAHLESILAGAAEETAEVGEPPHVTGLMGLYTEIGVVNRRAATPDAIINEIREATTARHTTLVSDMPSDGTAKPSVIFGGVPWDWRTLLRNRPIDIWMHEQDVRRAVGRPGGMDTAPANHTVGILADRLGFVLAKKVGAEPGTTLVLHVEGFEPYAFVVNDDGRGERLPATLEQPTVELAMDRESFIRLAGGRRAAEPDALRISGDHELAERVLANFATTP